MRKNKYVLVISIFVLLICTGCYFYAVRYNGEYSGKVIDADTGEPLEGVVVLGVWNVFHAGAAGAVSEFYDARETLTDKNGGFSIPGMGLRVISNLEPMDVFLFKAGYEHIGYGPWKSFKVDPILNKKIKWEGDKAIIPLRKLTIEERKKEGPPSRPSIPVEKMKLLTKEINKERIELGLTPFKLENNDI